MEYSEIFSYRLKKIRKSFGITQIDLARVLQTGQSTIAKLEKGTLEPDLKTLFLIGNSFGISTDYFIGLDYKTEKAIFELKYNQIKEEDKEIEIENEKLKTSFWDMEQWTFKRELHNVRKQINDIRDYKIRLFYLVQDEIIPSKELLKIYDIEPYEHYIINDSERIRSIIEVALNDDEEILKDPPQKIHSKEEIEAYEKMLEKLKEIHEQKNKTENKKNRKKDKN
jgi:transcriptional regulator with XRE-family HTH domain